jgi:hypothetical protein
MIILHFEQFFSETYGPVDAEFKECPNMNFSSFLNSLIDRSYIFDGFTNGTISIDRRMSIILSIPPRLDMSYLTSADSENAVDSVVSMLKRDGSK